MTFSNYIHKANAEYHRIRKRIPLGVFHSEEEYKNAVSVLDKMIDEIGQNENHPLAEMAEALALFIHSYEEAHFSLPESFGPEILKNLMEEHRLNRKPRGRLGNPFRQARTERPPNRQTRGALRGFTGRVHSGSAGQKEKTHPGKKVTLPAGGLF